MQGRGPWMASCMYVCKHESVSVCDFIRLCVCEARPEITSRSWVPQPAVSLQLQSARTATQSAELQKLFFFPSSLPLSIPPPPLPLLLSLFDGYSWNGNKHLSNCISLHFGISWRSWAGLIQLQTTLNMNQCFSNSKQLQNGMRCRLKQLNNYGLFIKFKHV